MMSDDSGLMFPKPKKKKKRMRHKKSILQTQKHICYLCAKLDHDYRWQQTEEHHVLFGAGQRKASEEEGLKVNLCIPHHRTGPDAVHNNQEIRNQLCQLAQEEFEQTHTHKEWMEKFRKNYL